MTCQTRQSVWLVTVRSLARMMVVRRDETDSRGATKRPNRIGSSGVNSPAPQSWSRAETLRMHSIVHRVPPSEWRLQAQTAQSEADKWSAIERNNKLTSQDSNLSRQSRTKGHAEATRKEVKRS
jgi:hypothetical protein